MTDLFEQANISIENKTIEKVTLENYRNIAYDTFTFNAKGSVLSGKNGIGKTNVIESIYWVLSGKLFNGLSQNHMIGVTPEGSEKGTKTKVEITFRNGFKIEKVFWEKWNDETYQGTETSFYINGNLEKRVSSAERAINRQLGLEEIGNSFSDTKLKDIDLIALFYRINYLQNIDYKLLRLLITDIVGEIDFKEIINENPEKYGRLVKPLKEHDLSLENLKEATRISKFGSKEKSGVLDRIKAVENTIETVEVEANKSVDEQEIKDAKDKIKALKAERDELSMGMRKSQDEKLSDITSKINENKVKLSELKEDIRVEHEKELKAFNENKDDSELTSKKEKVKELKDTRMELQEKIYNLSYEVKVFAGDIKNKKSEYADLSGKRQNLIDEWKRARNPQESETVTCPYCEKPFELSTCKEHQDMLNKRLDEINGKGQKIKVKMEGLQEGVETLEHEMSSREKVMLGLQKEFEQNDKNIATLETAIRALEQTSHDNAISAPTLDFNSQDVINLTREIATLETERNGLKIDVATQQQKDESKLQSIETEIEELEEVASTETTRKAYLETARKEREKLDELKRNRNDLDDITTLIKEVERETFEKLDKKLISAFGENFYFQLYKINLNETIDTRMCEMFVRDIRGKMVNIKNINNGLLPIRVLEFISKIKLHYEIDKSFVFIDEIGNLDTEHKKLLTKYDEQIIATEGTDYEKITKVDI